LGFLSGLPTQTQGEASSPLDWLIS
jgi:hypothetical protein